VGASMILRCGWAGDRGATKEHGSAVIPEARATTDGAPNLNDMIARLDQLQAEYQPGPAAAPRRSHMAPMTCERDAYETVPTTDCQKTVRSVVRSDRIADRGRSGVRQKRVLGMQPPLYGRDVSLRSTLAGCARRLLGPDLKVIRSRHH